VSSNECIIRVDIPTGRVLEDNLHAFWETQSRRSELPDPVWHSNPAMHGYAGPQPRGAQTGTVQPPYELLERVQRFNAARRRRTKNAWTDTEMYRLAVLVAVQNQKPHQAAARLARTPRACRDMFRTLKNAGVI
jgi:hypothetical protein